MTQYLEFLRFVKISYKIIVFPTNNNNNDNTNKNNSPALLYQMPLIQALLTFLEIEF